MNISLKSALKAPFTPKFTAILGILGTVLLLVEILSPASIFKGIIPTTAFSPDTTDILILLLSLGVQFFATGYVLKFAHNRVHGKETLFENLSLKHIWWGFKSFVFTIILVATILLIMAPALMVLSLFHPIIRLILFILIIFFLVLYACTCWSKFIDTLRLTEPLRLPSTYYLLSNAWRSYLKIIGYSVLALLIMIVPIITVNILTALAMIFVPLSVYIGIFAIAFTTLYPSFVFAHIMAQGYAGIKVDLKAERIEKAKLERVQTTPATVSNTVAKDTFVSDKKTSSSVQPVKPKKIATKRKIMLPEGAPKTAVVHKARNPVQKKRTATKKS